MLGRDALHPYLLIQRKRIGLSTDLVRKAGRVLELPWEEVEGRARALIQERFDLRGRPAFEWLDRQPLGTKATVEAAYSSMSPSETAGWELRRTSGSAGAPFSFRRDRIMLAWMEATSLALYAWHGQKPWRRQARFWGAPLTRVGRIGQTVKDRILGRRRLSAFELSDRVCADHFHALLKFRPCHAYGYPSVIREFAERCSGAGLDGQDLGLEVVFTTGEPLFPATREGLQEFFGCRVVNEYGCTESGILGFECEEGFMHLTPVASWIEILHEETGQPVTGQPGLVTLTDLMGSARPFLRYQLGDKVTLTAGGRCPCGRELPRIRVENARTKALIQLPSGNTVGDTVLAYSAPEGVAQFIGKQVSLDTLDVDVVVLPSFDPGETIENFRRSLTQALGPEMSVTVRAVGSIPRETSGKLRYFIPLDSEAN